MLKTICFRLVGKLAWAYFQQKDYKSAEEYYRFALFIKHPCKRVTDTAPFIWACPDDAIFLFTQKSTVT